MGLNYFEGVPMKIIVDHLTVALIEELHLEPHLANTFEAMEFRVKVDRAVWQTYTQTKGGNWHAGFEK